MPLTRNIGTRYHEVHDEITTAFNYHIPVQKYRKATVDLQECLLMNDRMDQNHSFPDDNGYRL